MRYAIYVAVMCSCSIVLGDEASKTIWLDALDVSQTRQGWGEPHANKSVDGHSLTIADKTYEHGLGTHAESHLFIATKGATRFTAMVGVDDEVKNGASVVFQVVGDKKMLFDSGVMKHREAAKKVDVDVSGIRKLELRDNDAGDGVTYDHADWADAKFEYAVDPPVVFALPKVAPYVLTPKPGRGPRINGPKVLGVRPGHSVLFTAAATGDRPMRFSADNLPEGLTLDPSSGRIAGKIDAKGEHAIVLHAHNDHGEATRPLKIVVGDIIALTPPMGWNSWNCWAEAVSDEKVRASADAMVASGLIDHGLRYVNIDDCWEIKPSKKDDPVLGGPQRNPDGSIRTNGKFPDMKGLAEYVHGKGLKIGLYSSPGPLTCGGYVASYGHELDDAKQYAAWGFDYLKYDWCSYGKIADDIRRQSQHPDEREILQKPYSVMLHALDQVDRDIVYSLCQYGMGDVWTWGSQVGGNSWRTTGDINDSWQSMSSIGFGQAGHEKFAGPGHWNDPDMLVVGKVGWGPSLHPTKLNPDEQYTHISLWCLLSAPLLIGCDMTQLDDFTLSLLTNDEVLEVDQDALGKQAARISKDGDVEVWAKELEDGSRAVGLFNRADEEQNVVATFASLGISGSQSVRDLWRQKDLGNFADRFEAKVPAHGVVLVKITPAK